MILLSDTNIFLDLECIGLLEDVMALPDVVCTELMLFRDEIRRPLYLKNKLLLLGLNVVQATNEEFALSQQIQDMVRYILITSDKRLRQTSESAGVETHGLLFLIDKCIAHGTPKDHIETAIREIIRNPKILIPTKIILDKYAQYLE